MDYKECLDSSKMLARFSTVYISQEADQEICCFAF